MRKDDQSLSSFTTKSVDLQGSARTDLDVGPIQLTILEQEYVE